METKRLLKCSMQLAMLGQLLARGKITETEYRKIMQRLKKDYGILQREYNINEIELTDSEKAEFE